MIKIKMTSECSTSFAEYMSISDIIKSNIKNGPWLAGGAVTSIKNNRIPRDYDVFCKNDHQRMLLEKRLLKHSFILTRKSAFATTFISQEKLHIDGSNNVIVQIINGNFNSIDKLFDSFDFTICQMAMDKEYVVARKSSIEDDNNKILKIHSISNPLNTLMRISKYNHRGYKLDMESAKAAAIQLMETILE